MARDKTLDDLFLDTLKDVYYAERKILKSLPKMKKAAVSADLKSAFDTHHAQTEDHVQRLEQVFDLLGKPARGKTCDAIEGIITEAEDIIAEYTDSPALDAGLIAVAQAVEHYEIARYGTLHRWAKELGMTDATKILNETLQEEWATDVLLTKMADAGVNDAAKDGAAQAEPKVAGKKVAR